MHKGFNNLENFLSKYTHIIISTHESPDGDGLGAEIAFNELLKKLGKETLIINSDPVPDIFQFIDIENEIHTLRTSTIVPDGLKDYALIVLDTNDDDNIGSLFPIIKDEIKDIFIIDHHEGEKDKIERNFIKVESSSVCEIIYSIIQYFEKDISLKSAQALFAGMVYDTGSFRYPKTTSETFKVAAHLVEIGANPFKIFEHIYESNTLSSFELRSHILSTMEILNNGKLIAMKLTPKMLKKTGGSFTEGESAINLPLTVRGVIASILVKQDFNGPVKVSMRTKGEYNVAEIAIENGGGGHRNAAGYKSKDSFDKTYKSAIKNVKSLFE